MQDYTMGYKKIATEEARLLKHLAECATIRAELLKLEVEQNGFLGSIRADEAINLFFLNLKCDLIKSGLGGSNNPINRR